MFMIEEIFFLLCSFKFNEPIYILQECKTKQNKTILLKKYSVTEHEGGIDSRYQYLKSTIIF